jgi:transmembrane sensor
VTTQRPTPETIEKAAWWAAQLATDEATKGDRDACEAWCRAHPTHRLALERMRGLDVQIGDADPIGREAIAKMLRPRSKSGRRIGGLALGLVLLVGCGWLSAQSLTVRAWFPDLETGRGEQRTVTLADGSGLTLDTDAALDFETDADRRHVTLFRGQILAHVARDATRPFVVETRHGTATALGTAFTVRQDENVTTVTVLESRVRACPATAEGDCIDLQPGDRVRMGADGLERLGRVDPAAAGMWAEGWLAADDQPVVDVLTELNRYRQQPVRFETADLVGIRVSGSFPLADPNRALEGIVRSTGLTMSRSGDGSMLVRRAK